MVQFKLLHKSLTHVPASAHNKITLARGTRLAPESRGFIPASSCCTQSQKWSSLSTWCKNSPTAALHIAHGSCCAPPTHIMARSLEASAVAAFASPAETLLWCLREACYVISGIVTSSWWRTTIWAYPRFVFSMQSSLDAEEREQLMFCVRSSVCPSEILINFPAGFIASQ